MRPVHEALIVVILACSLAGCAEEPEAPIYTCTDPDVLAYFNTPRPDYPLVWETAHLNIYAKEDVTVCAGTAAEFERHVMFVADTLGIEPREHIPLYMSAGWPTKECKKNLVAGCSTNDGVTFSSPTASYHELVHALACQIRMVQTPAIAEGLAYAFTPREGGLYLDDGPNLRKAFSATADEYTHRINDQSPHFIRWLVETRGGESVAEVYRIAPAPLSYGGDFDGEQIIAAFESVYQTDFDDLEREFWQTSPGYSYPPYRQCADIPHVEPDANGEWHFMSVMDCDDESTFGPYERISSAERPSYDFGLVMHQSFTIDIPKAGFYLIDYDDGTNVVRMERCVNETADTEEESMALYSVVTAYEPWNNDVELIPGTWRLDVLRDYGDPAPVEVVVQRIDGTDG